MSDRAAVVTCFLHHRGEVLLCRRAHDADTYPDQWAGISGYVENDDLSRTARMEIREETGIDDPTLVRAGEPFTFHDPELAQQWTIHPFLFDVDTREIHLGEEHTTCDWTPPTEILQRESVPELWTSYERVAPSVETIATDRNRGSAALSIVALEVLRDRAAAIAHGQPDGAGKSAGGRPSADDLTRVSAVAERLLDARPSMVVLRNRVNRAMVGANAPAAAERAAIEGIQQAFEADVAAAETAAEAVSGTTVLSLSRSGTILDALLAGIPDRVVVAESRPLSEGVGVAETLADAGIPTTLCTDAAIGHVLGEEAIDTVLVGADAIGPDGTVVNKTGTRGAAVAAARENVPFLVAAATDKVSPDGDLSLEAGDPADVYDGDASLAAINPTFDRTPGDLVDGFLTERGRLSTTDLTPLAEEFRALGDWRGGQESNSADE